MADNGNSEPKKASTGAQIAVGLILGVFIILVFRMCMGPLGNDSTEEKALTPEEQRTEFIGEQFSAWNGSHRKLVEYVKDNMNDPDSFEHEETRYRDDGETLFVIMEFRGANAFGGTVLNTVQATVDTASGEVLEVHSLE